MVISMRVVSDARPEHPPCRFTGDHEVRSALSEMRVPRSSIVALQEITRSRADSFGNACPAVFDRRFTGDHKVTSTLFRKRVFRGLRSSPYRRSRGHEHTRLKTRVPRSSIVALQEITR